MAVCTILSILDLSPADAAVDEVKDGKFFFSVETPIKEGTMPTKAIVASNDLYEAGYHAGNAGGLDAIDTDLAPANIKKNVNIFGKIGTHEFTYILGSVMLFSVAETLNAPGEPAKACAFTLGNPLRTTIKTTFELASGVADNLQEARVYKNGSPLGTLRGNNTTEYICYDENLSFASSDQYEIWCVSWSGSSGYWRVKHYGVKGTVTMFSALIQQGV